MKAEELIVKNLISRFVLQLDIKVLLNEGILFCIILVSHDSV